MREDGYDFDERLNEWDVISTAIIRKRLGLSQRRFAEAIRVPVATLQNWEQGQTPMDPSAKALMTILAREPEAALRALRHERADRVGRDRGIAILANQTLHYCGDLSGIVAITGAMGGSLQIARYG